MKVLVPLFMLVAGQARAAQLFCQSDMAKAADAFVQSQASAENPGKKIDVFESSTSDASGFIGAGHAAAPGIPADMAVDYGTVKGSYYIGGYGQGGMQLNYEADVYLKPGTCNVVAVKITRTTGGGILE